MNGIFAQLLITNQKFPDLPLINPTNPPIAAAAPMIIIHIALSVADPPMNRSNSEVSE
jgi:hypothetical protein